MRIYVKPNISALNRVHEKLVELDKSHLITVSYSKKYGHYGVVDLFEDAITCVGVLNSYGVEQLPKLNNN